MRGDGAWGALLGKSCWRRWEWDKFRPVRSSIDWSLKSNWREEKRRNCLQALERLPESYRVPLLCQVLGGFRCQEIAQMLGLNEAAVMTRLTRARKALRLLVEGRADGALEVAK